MSLVFAASMIASAIAFSSPSALAEPDPRAHERWVRVHLGPEDLDVLSLRGVDVLADHPRPGWVDLLVEAHAWPELMARDLELRVVHEDVGAWMLAERARLATRAAAGEDFLATFRSFEEIEDWLTLVHEDAPERTAKLEIGRSLEDRPIHALEIGPIEDPEAPVLIVQAGQHAREWIAVMASLCLVDTLVVAPEATALGPLLERMRIVVVPVSNPDGYVYSWEVDRLWRKNRRDGTGVDTNRNFGTAFGGPGSSDDPAEQNYRGTAAFSEPETAAIRELALSYPNLRGYVDLHSFGQLVLHPWGFPTVNPPLAAALFESVGGAMVEAILDAEGAVYESIPALELYASAGASDDWFYGELGAVAFALELRPDDAEIGFEIGEEAIDPVCHEVRSAIETLALAIVDLEPLPAGDDGSPPPPEPEDESTSSESGTTSGDETSSSEGDDTTSSTTALAGESTGTDGSSGSTTTAAQEDSEGCACHATRNPLPAAWLIPLTLATMRRRRGTAPHRRTGSTRSRITAR